MATLLKQTVEKLLRGRSAALPLVRKLNVPNAVHLGFSLACALHLDLLLTFFNSPLEDFS